MAFTGQVLDNPISGERFVLHQTAADTGGQLLALTWCWPPGGHVPGGHVHPVQQERFQVLHGGPCCRHGATSRRRMVCGRFARMSEAVTSGPRHSGEAVAVADERATLEAFLDLYRDMIKRLNSSSEVMHVTQSGDQEGLAGLRARVLAGRPVRGASERDARRRLVPSMRHAGHADSLREQLDRTTRA